MDLNDKPEFVRALTGLAAIKRIDLTKEAYEMWWLSMQDWSIDDFTKAAGLLLKTCEFMPAPNNFEELKRMSEPSAHEAWAIAYKACMGWREGKGSGNDLIDSVVRAMGGYREIALCDLDKLAFMERRFVDSYKDFAKGDYTRKALPEVSGSAKITNGMTSIADVMPRIENNQTENRDEDDT